MSDKDEIDLTQREDNPADVLTTDPLESDVPQSALHSQRDNRPDQSGIDTARRIFAIETAVQLKHLYTDQDGFFKLVDSIESKLA
jgi:hypothetical protein